MAMIVSKDAFAWLWSSVVYFSGLY